jgi:hypothetical protein
MCRQQRNRSPQNEMLRTPFSASELDITMEVSGAGNLTLVAVQICPELVSIRFVSCGSVRIRFTFSFFCSL